MLLFRLPYCLGFEISFWDRMLCLIQRNMMLTIFLTKCFVVPAVVAELVRASISWHLIDSKVEGSNPGVAVYFSS